MRIVNGIDSARRALSEGRTLDLASVPSSFTDTAERIFGSRLTPTETVARIIDVVREEGDAGVLRLAHAIEGSRQQTLEVSPLSRLKPAWIPWTRAWSRPSDSPRTEYAATTRRQVRAPGWTSTPGTARSPRRARPPVCTSPVVVRLCRPPSS